MKRKKTGRPRSVMTAEAEDKILQTVRLGVWPDRAAQVHGISAGSMRAHKRRKPEFATALEKAEAEAEQFFHSRILNASSRQWTAAAWMLERRWPARYAKREPEVEVNIHQTQEGPKMPPPGDFAAYIESLAAAAATLGIGHGNRDRKPV